MIETVLGKIKEEEGPYPVWYQINGEFYSLSEILYIAKTMIAANGSAVVGEMKKKRDLITLPAIAF